MARNRNHTDHPKRRMVIIAVLLCALCVVLSLWYAYPLLFYPLPHKNQLSPLPYIQKKTKTLPDNLQLPLVIEHGSRTKHAVALTFDADMTYGMQNLLKRGIVKSWYNKAIIDTLHKENTKATIFLTGLWVRIYPNEARTIATDPLFEIGNHSYSHPAFAPNCFRLPLIDNSKNFDEINDAQQAIRQITGITPKYFRFPGGCYEKFDLESIVKAGLTIVHWDVVSGDAFNTNTQSIIKNVESKVQNGSIIVFHLHGGTYAPKTNDALIHIIPDLKKQGYQFVTVSQLISED